MQIDYMVCEAKNKRRQEKCAPGSSRDRSSRGGGGRAVNKVHIGLQANRNVRVSVYFKLR